MRKIKDEEKQKIASEYSKGKRAADLAVEYDVSKVTINRIIKSILDGNDVQRLFLRAQNILI